MLKPFPPDSEWTWKMPGNAGAKEGSLLDITKFSGLSVIFFIYFAEGGAVCSCFYIRISQS